MKLIKVIEWDMGHRLTNNDSKCQNLHGHRYRAEICLEGSIIEKDGDSKEGMVVDFRDIKEIARKEIYDVLDHSCMIWGKDKLLVEFFEKNKTQKHIVVPFVTTAENIAIWIFKKLDKEIKDKYKSKAFLHSVKVWETPTSAAICTREDINL